MTSEKNTHKNQLHGSQLKDDILFGKQINLRQQRVLTKRYLKKDYDSTIVREIDVEEYKSLLSAYNQSNDVWEENNKYYVREPKCIEHHYHEIIDRVLKIKDYLSDEQTEQLKQYMLEGKVVSGGRVLSGAGITNRTMYNCQKMQDPIDALVDDDDLRISDVSIYNTDSKLARSFAQGFGVGITLDNIRPKNMITQKSGGTSPEIGQWMEKYAATATGIRQEGNRGGALMLSLSDWNPNIIDFIKTKSEGKWNVKGANVSVLISDKFMQFLKHPDCQCIVMPHANIFLKKDAELEQIEGNPWISCLNKNIVAVYERSIKIKGKKLSLFHRHSDSLGVTMLFAPAILHTYHDTNKWECYWKQPIAYYKYLNEKDINDSKYIGNFFDKVSEYITDKSSIHYISELQDAISNEDITITTQDLLLYLSLAFEQNVNEQNDEIILDHPYLNNFANKLTHSDKWVYNTQDIYNAITERMYGIKGYGGEPGVIFIDKMNYNNNATFLGDNIISCNPCGEIPLHSNPQIVDDNGHILRKEEWGVCNLHHLVLYNFLHIQETRGGEDNEKHSPYWECIKDITQMDEKWYKCWYDFKGLVKATKLLVRFADSIIDKSSYLGPDANNQFKYRHIGIGHLSLADLLFDLQIKYGSDESIELADRIQSAIAIAAYEESIQLAKEHGSFPQFNADKFLNGSSFASTLPKSLKKEIRKHGIRNATLLTIAPNGSTGELMSLCSGIEPVFRPIYVRYDRLGTIITKSSIWERWENILKPKYQEYMETSYKISNNGNGNGKASSNGFKILPFDAWIHLQEQPEWMINSFTVSPKDHIKMQAIMQKNVDNSISKTINAPNTQTYEEMQDIFMEAWECNLKGFTYYRSNSMKEQVLTAVDTEQIRWYYENRDKINQKIRV